jgi:NAD(P)-dependent dehydrogenase (short-subunit alcohol dehydrogenase family)
MKLRGKVGIVTGATSGIGRAIAVEFAREGADITAVGRDGNQLQKTKKIIEAGGGACLMVKADLQNLSEIDRIVQNTLDRFGKVDLLVNCAGIFETCDFLETPEDLFDRTMAINLKSLFFMSQRVAKEMKKQGNGGKIINFSSIGPCIALPRGQLSV